MRQNEATLRQIEAADPTANTWLSANAGSGKTRVLTDRVARLLLAGVRPENILCLTYTKAAASEMQNRLFARLGAWAMKPDDELRKELGELGVDDVGDLPRARRLFAAAIETPGGLKIQTIHSFCAAILRRFPLEAGVTPQFQEIDDRSARLLQAEILDVMAAGAERGVLEELAAFFTDPDFAGLTAEIVRRRAAFLHEVAADEIWRWFGLAPGFDEAALPGIAFDGSERGLIAQVGPILAAQSATMQSLADRLARLNFDAPGLDDLAALYDAFLYKGAGGPRAEAKTNSVPTKKAGTALGPLLGPFHDFMDRVARARETELALEAARKTRALHRFARPFVQAYEARKQDRGWLDFDDLILRAGALLNDPALAAWVLYRLDGGIDHILVDEAQDTSPEQWRVIESLAREFTAGQSAREDRRTLFVVGDMKQSIYSFQGADPSEFLRMKSAFGERFAQVGQRLHALELEYSFRSSLAILELVDTALDHKPGLGDAVSHKTFDISKPGRVDLWPVVEKAEAEPVGHWTDPVDMPAPKDAAVVLANAVADGIAEMIETGSIPAKEGGMTPVLPGNIIVLVRRRSELFRQIIRACKQRGVPIAGADRLRIGGELAVKDLTAMLAFLATPEDDLSLAAALRSPLFGLSEDALFRLAHGRDKAYLWNVLREDEGHVDARAMFDDLRGQADYLRPYELIDRILTRHDGRRRLVARLGPEAEDGIDALLAQALAYERIEVPSLTGFLTWLAAEEVEIKRQMDSASDRVRVMTVHGAKGLEAPVVILPDTAKRRANDRDRMVELAGGTAWRVGRDAAPAPVRAAAEAKAEREREEDMRLLYVALTRAESWLVIAAAGDVGDAGESWYRVAEAGLKEAGAVACDFGLGSGLRYETGEWGAAVRGEAAVEDRGAPDLPRWVGAVAAVPEPVAGPLVPSDLGGAKIVGEVGETDPMVKEGALRHGRQIHRLLEFLPGYPEESWPEVARALLGEGEDAVGPEEADALRMEAAGVLAMPELAPLFGANTLAEVEISAPLDIDGRTRVHGVIDRLVVGPDSVLAVDFKTNRVVPETAEAVPEGILRQMGAYELALGEVFPGRRIETAILWTGGPRLMVLPPGLALRAFGRLDAGQARS